MKKKEIKICANCEHCVYIGEGDYICDVDEPIIVMEEHIPNDNYFICGGADWEDSDNFE